MKDYQRNNILYGRLLDAAGDDKLPILDNKTFESMNAEYGKEEMRKNLADYIATERPVFPLKEISEDDYNNSKVISNPLKMYDCSPISDGAVGLMLSCEKTDIRVSGLGHATDTVSLKNRVSLSHFAATKPVSYTHLRAHET